MTRIAFVAQHSLAVGSRLDATSAARQPWKAHAYGILLATAVALLTAVNSNATTYHVSPTGSDTNPGTQAAPWRTIGKAANVLGPGDTAVIGNGKYVEKVTVTKSGTPTAPIVFQAAPGQTPVIDGAGLSTGTYGSLWAFSGASYVKLDGLTIKNSQGYCVSLSGNSTISMWVISTYRTVRPQAQSGWKARLSPRILRSMIIKFMTIPTVGSCSGTLRGAII